MSIPRSHFFEIHEQSWVPSFIRDGVTDGLYTVWKVLFWKNTLPHIADLLTHAKGNRVLDLCSGAGGPIPIVAEAIQEHTNARFLLSDIHPHSHWNESNSRLETVFYHPESVSALAVDNRLCDARTLFESFHHFRPADAISILKDAVDANQPIAVFEFQRRSIIDMLLPPISLVIVVAVFLHWFYTPFRWSKVFFTLIPIIPFILIFDGIVSVLRTYTVHELGEMAKQAGDDKYRWEVRQTVDRGFGRITCLIGWPSAEGGVHQIDYKYPNRA